MLVSAEAQMSQPEWNPLKPIIKYAKCKACRFTSGLLHSIVSSDTVVTTVVSIIKLAMLTKFSWSQATIILDAYVPPIVSGLRNKALNPDAACEAKFEYCKATHFKARHVEDDVRRILSDKPESLRNDDFIDSLY